MFFGKRKLSLCLGHLFSRIRLTFRWHSAETSVEHFGLLILYSVPFYMSLNKNHPSHLAALPPSISDSKRAYPHNYLYYTIISLLEQCDLHSAQKWMLVHSNCWMSYNVCVALLKICMWKAAIPVPAFTPQSEPTCPPPVCFTILQTMRRGLKVKNSTEEKRQWKRSEQ